MATIDLKDAYYSVKIQGDDTYFLKFLCNSILLKFAVLANSLSPGPRKFTKLTNPSLAMLRMQGYTVAIYIDDIVVIVLVEFASFIGTLTSSFSGNQFGPLYHRAMLKFKDKSLKYNKVNFNAVIKLSEDTLHQISCWKKSILEVFKLIRYPRFIITIYTDASLKGWVPPWVMSPQVGHGFQMRS